MEKTIKFEIKHALIYVNIYTFINWYINKKAWFIFFMFKNIKGEWWHDGLKKQNIQLEVHMKNYKIRAPEIRPIVTDSRELSISSKPGSKNAKRVSVRATDQKNRTNDQSMSSSNHIIRDPHLSARLRFSSN